MIFESQWLLLQIFKICRNTLVYMVSFNTCKIMIYGSNCSHYSGFFQLTQRPISRPEIYSKHSHMLLQSKKVSLTDEYKKKKRTTCFLFTCHEKITKKEKKKKETEKLQKLEKISIHSAWSLQPSLEGWFTTHHTHPISRVFSATFCEHLGTYLYVFFLFFFCVRFFSSSPVFMRISDIFIGCYLIFFGV